jgi:hypothetical protein
MSIALATICQDGLVICADRQLSNPSGFKFYECKLSKIPLAPNSGTVVLGYAGSPDTMKIIVESLRAKFEQQNKSSDQIEAGLQETLNDVIPKNPKEHHLTLCGFGVNGTLRLLKTWDRTISPVTVWDCVGFGDSALTRYLGSIFLGTEIHLPIFRAVPICNYMVSQAKKYVDGCGGQTDLVVMAPNGEVSEQTDSKIIELMCEVVENMLNSLLTSATEPNATPEQIEHLIKQLGYVTKLSTTLFDGFIKKPKGV